MTKLRFSLAALLFSALASGCAQSSPNSCQELDWYEIGRQDGSKGFSMEKRRDVKIVCEASDPSLSEALYHNGFDAGASHFCDPKNAFNLGRQLQKVSIDICPPLLREEFRQSYEAGQKQTLMKEQGRNFDRRLLLIQEALEQSGVDLARRGLLQGEKLEIESKKRALSISFAMSKQ